ncbi:lantibiotic dehydratase, partial [Streptococcus pneumoniae]|uniref:lantibiotic dehydratase n=1 Tax=Streptococcus pneumoniae TaxID=1313 RepID=UPI000A7362D3
KSEVSVLDLVQEIQTKSPNLETQKIIDYLRNLIISEFLFTNLRKVVINHNCLDNLIYILSSINEQTKLTTDLLQLKSCIDEKYGEYVEVPIKQLLDSKLGLGIPKQNLEPYSILSSVAEQTFLSYLSKEIF